MRYLGEVNPMTNVDKGCVIGEDVVVQRTDCEGYSFGYKRAWRSSSLSAWVTNTETGVTYSSPKNMDNFGEDLALWLAWAVSNLAGVEDDKVRYKLYKTKTLKYSDDPEDKVKYRWYLRYHFNKAGYWYDHVFLYDSTRPTDGWFDWEADSFPSANEWFEGYGV